MRKHPVQKAHAYYDTQAVITIIIARRSAHFVCGGVSAAEREGRTHWTLDTGVHMCICIFKWANHCIDTMEVQ